MNRIITLLISLTMMSQMLLSVITTGFAQVNIELEDEKQTNAYNKVTDEEYYPEKYIGYYYPVRPGTAEWSKLPNHQAMVDACMIPEDILTNMTSEALVQSILAYPLLVDMYAYDDAHRGLAIVTKHFNGLAELSMREDGASALVDAYVAHSLDEMATKTYASDADYAHELNYSESKYLFKSMVLCTMLTDDTYTDELTETDIDLLKGILLPTASGDREMFLDGEPGNASTLASYTYMYELYGNVVEDQSWAETIIGGTVIVSSTLWKGYWLCSDNVIRDQITSDMSSQHKTALSNQVYDVYNIRPIAAATAKYNCHSYAWYWQSTANTYWINDPSAYFVTRGRVAAANVVVNNKIVYFESTNGSNEELTHSGVVSGISTTSSGRVFTIKSKWGAMGLYEHRLENCPYYYQDNSVSPDYLFYTT